MISWSGRRVVAGLIDLGLTAVICGVVVLMSAAARAANWLTLGDLATQLAVAAITAVVATVVMAAFEASAFEASPGKLARGLRVRRHPSGERLSLLRALLRNLLKLGLPLPLAYLAGVAAYDGGPGVAWVGLAAALVVAISYLAGAVFWDGRTAYDQVSGSMVIPTMPGRRYA